jgi:hypothetical protein
MELTKTEMQTVVVALGVAIEHANHAIEGLLREQRNPLVREAIHHRRRHLSELERLRERLKVA